MNTFRILSFGTIVFALFAAPLCAADDSFNRVIAPFLKQHCLDCHGTEEPASQLRLDQLQSLAARDRHLWTLVYEQIASGAMPRPISHDRLPRRKKTCWPRSAKDSSRWAVKRRAGSIAGNSLRRCKT